MARPKTKTGAAGAVLLLGALLLAAKDGDEAGAWVVAGWEGLLASPNPPTLPGTGSGSDPHDGMPGLLEKREKGAELKGEVAAPNVATRCAPWLARLLRGGVVCCR